MKYTLSVLVENQAGVLSKVSGLFQDEALIQTALQLELQKTAQYLV